MNNNQLIHLIYFILLAINPVYSQDQSHNNLVLEEAIQRAYTFQGSNEDWQPFEWEFDGVPMMLVPVGCFMMGSTQQQLDDLHEQLMEQYQDAPNDAEWISDFFPRLFEIEMPQHPICFDEPFWIDKYPVTNQQFEGFLSAGGYENRLYWEQLEASQIIYSPNRIGPYPRYWLNNGGAKHPVIALSWSEAVAYANWRGASLPTEAQWEYVARGLDNWAYPWGNDLDCRHSSCDVNGYLSVDRNWTTFPIGSFPTGASWVGTVDMLGGLLEWTSSQYAPYPYHTDDGRENFDASLPRIQRGGERITTRHVHNPEIAVDQYHTYGLRLVRPIDPLLDQEIIADEPALPVFDLSIIPRDSPFTQDLSEITSPINNVDWSPIEHHFYGTEMVFIPAGCFSEPSGEEICLDTSFWLGKFEVTNLEYARFIADGGYDNSVYWSTEGWQVRQAHNWTYPAYWTDERFNAADQPVIGISWYEADAYARWFGGELPNVEQWRYVVSGPDGLMYPWAGQRECDENTCHVNYCDDNCRYFYAPGGSSPGDDGYAYTAPVGSYPTGASWVGAFDLYGNVWEWTNSLALSMDTYILVGGAFDEDIWRISTGNLAPMFRYGSFGFRVILSEE